MSGLILGVIQRGTANDQPSRSDNGGKCSLQSVSCVAENIKIKWPGSQLNARVCIPTVPAKRKYLAYPLQKVRSKEQDRTNVQLSFLPGGPGLPQNNSGVHSVLKVIISQSKHILFSLCLAWIMNYKLTPLIAPKILIPCSPLVRGSSSRLNN